jgi:methylated-DNA-protein-cysteine methyltransferase-like protein
MDERLDELVLRAVELVPWGHVVSYGDLGHVVGIGPRRVGSVLSRHGGGVAWWRVTNAAGDFPPDLLVQAVPHWREEGIALRPTGRGCRIADHRADLVELERRWRVAAADVLAEAEAEADVRDEGEDRDG